MSSNEEKKSPRSSNSRSGIEFGVDSKCKMDVGYKKFLRCARKCIRTWFDEWCPTKEAARYKWNKKANKAEIWFTEAKRFLSTEVLHKEQARSLRMASLNEFTEQ